MFNQRKTAKHRKQQQFQKPNELKKKQYDNPGSQLMQQFKNHKNGQQDIDYKSFCQIKRTQRLANVYLKSSAFDDYTKNHMVIPGMIKMYSQQKKIIKMTNKTNIQEKQFVVQSNNSIGRNYNLEIARNKRKSLKKVSSIDKQSRSSSNQKIQLNHIFFPTYYPKLNLKQAQRCPSNNKIRQRNTYHLYRKSELQSKRQINSKNQNSLDKKVVKTARSSYKINNNNDKQFNVEVILRRKYQLSFNEFIAQYQKRMQLPNKSIFIFDSSDVWVKRILCERGWQQNPHKQSYAYHLKWTNKICPLPTYMEQKINHFPMSDQLTSKSGLMKNASKKQHLKQFIPRTYDLGSQLYEFKQNFEQTCLLSLLKRIHQHISHKVNIIELKIIPKEELILQCKNIIKNKLFLKSTNRQQQILLHVPYTIQLIAYVISILQRIRYKQLQQFLTLYQTSIDKLISFAKLELPYDEYAHNVCKQDNQHRSHINFGDNINIYHTKNSFGYVSINIIQLIVSLHQIIKSHIGSYQTDGFHNLWIIKCATSSKAIGIKIENSMQQIIKHKQNRIAQKYVQNCFIIHDQSFISGRKFDLRIWVLIQSFNPLIAHYYKKFYARICSQKYNLQDPECCQNLHMHLTNYSKNKQNFKNQQESIMKDQQLFQKISKMKDLNIQEFKKQFYHKLNKMLLILFQQFSGKIESHQQSFELFGVDVLLDQKLNLHLLEVNLSPACKQRTQWLKEYVSQMANDMLDMVVFDGTMIAKGHWITIK